MAVQQDRLGDGRLAVQQAVADILDIEPWPVAYSISSRMPRWRSYDPSPIDCHAGRVDDARYLVAVEVEQASEDYRPGVEFVSGTVIMVGERHDSLSSTLQARIRAVTGARIPEYTVSAFEKREIGVKLVVSSRS